MAGTSSLRLFKDREISARELMVPPLLAEHEAKPGNAGARIHIRVRTDTIDNHGKISLRRAGKMHHLGLVRRHKGQPVLLLIADLDVRVVQRDTGELLAETTIDPTRGYQPQPRK